MSDYVVFFGCYCGLKYGIPGLDFASLISVLIVFTWSHSVIHVLLDFGDNGEAWAILFQAD
jgi:hypothetical protein